MEELRSYCLGKKGATEDFPFGHDVHVMKVGGKMFALLTANENGVQIGLKCEPDLADALRQQYPAIVPGYHLNQRHWITVTVDGSIPEPELLGLIDLSYHLVDQGLTRVIKHQIDAL
ncbi:MmcQ/YjbR family DNA-binding protein [Brevibacillus composti]|uniref:MmcQ/YjbR family DNA-binding protein n=1 Tax=Brevibacillus composti TaxID=2796470 RepID=A0A7T5JQN8_9BACL|nr:MmcQ/YjbR family DNA-binding protein [Brevibacillus composti]QQE76350.1 MmcQ/YjbR family DNA-binding protein [Brevibacillus composti]QUO43377.1 MmcQ/YjbR family DNA-binding protein [Brevibacillus composti]